MILLVPIEMKIVMHRHRQITARGMYARYVSEWDEPLDMIFDLKKLWTAASGYIWNNSATMQMQIQSKC